MKIVNKNIKNLNLDIDAIEEQNQVNENSAVNAITALNSLKLVGNEEEKNKQISKVTSMQTSPQKQSLGEARILVGISKIINNSESEEQDPDLGKI